MIDHSSEELIRRRVLFFPCERHRAEDQCLTDQCLTDLELATDLGLLPVYSDRLPRSNDVEVLRGGQIEFAFPLPPQKNKGVIQSKVAEVKRKLVRLLSLKDDESVAALTEIAGGTRRVASRQRRKRVHPHDSVSPSLSSPRLDANPSRTRSPRKVTGSLRISVL